MYSKQVFDQNGIKNIGVAGHPDGSPDFSDEITLAALRWKQNLSVRSDAKFRIVTQFGFDADSFISWAKSIRSADIKLPIHLGVAGPAKLTTLVRFAKACGVDNSIALLKKHPNTPMMLATGFEPENIVSLLEQY